MKRPKGPLKLVSNPLEAVLKKLGLESSVRLHKARQAWGSIFGPPLVLHSSPRSIEKNRLIVNADSHAWLQQLNFHKADIIKKLSALGLKDVQFRIGRVNSVYTPPVTSIPLRKLSELEEEFILKETANIQDHELKEKIEGAIRGWLQRKSPPKE